MVRRAAAKSRSSRSGSVFRRRSPGNLGERACTIFENRARVDCAVMARGGIAAASEITGAALIEDATATIYVPPGWRARRDGGDNLVLERMKGQG